MKIEMPKFKLNNFILRDICESDYLDLFDIGQDINVCKYLSWGPFKDIKEAKEIIFEHLTRPRDNEPVGYAICNKKNQMIGIIDFHSYNESDNSCQIAYLLKSSYQNKGIMQKAFKVMLDLAFDYQELDKVYVLMVEDNLRSLNLIEKFHFKYERSMYNIFESKIDSSLKNILVYSLYKNEREL